MDDCRFDNLARLAATTSRRRLVQSLLGAAAGGLLAVAGVRRTRGAEPCRPGGPDCEGCCIAGICLLGLTGAACGSGGERCKRCESYQECVEGLCLGKCRPETCTGCCVGSSICLLGLTEAACGTGGERCNRCQTGEQCVNGACKAASGTGGGGGTEPPGTPPPDEEAGEDETEGAGAGEGESPTTPGTPPDDEEGEGEGEDPTTPGTPPEGCNRDTCLNGCCERGVCISPPTNAACGIGGELCIACAANKICRGGFCQDPCGAGNCAGCCDQFHNCRPGTSGLSCGKDGEQCRPCLSGICRDGACLPCDEFSCADGCCDEIGVCRTPATPEYCGRQGGRCVECADGETCVNGRCVRDGGSQTSGINTRYPDYAFAAIRPTDWVDQPAGAGVSVAVLDDGVSFNYPDLIPAQRDQFFDPTLQSAFPADQMTTGYLGLIGIPSQNGSPIGWDQTVTTRWQSFDANANDVLNEIFPSFVSTYLAGTTPLQSDRTIGDGSVCHAWDGQTNDGSSYSSMLCAAVLGSAIIQVRHDSYTDAPPDQARSMHWLDELAERGRDMIAPGYDNLGTSMPYLQTDGGVRYGGYTAYDGTVFQPRSQDPSTFATRQERLTGIDRAFDSKQRITNASRWGDYSGFTGGRFEQFDASLFADSYVQMLGDYEAMDAAQQGVSANDWTETRAFNVPARGLQIRRPTSQGWLPTIQVDLQTGAIVAKFSTLGAYPVPADREATPEYWDTVGALTTAQAGAYLAGQNQAEVSQEEAALSLDDALGRYTELHDACFSSSPERCVAAGQVVTTEEEAATGPATGSFDLAATVITPIDVANTFGLDLETFQVAAGFTFTGIESASIAGFGGFETTPPPDQPADPVRGHFFRWLHRDETGQIDVNFSGVTFQTDADWIYDWLTIDYLAGATEISTEPDAQANVRLFDAERASTTGTPVYSQYAVYRTPSLAAFLDASFIGDAWDDEDTYWVAALRYAGEFSGFRAAAYPSDTPLVQILAERLAEIQAPDYEDLGTSFPAYSGPNVDPTLIFADGFESGDLSAWSVTQESYPVVDKQTIRQATQTEEQHAHHAKWNRDIDRAYQRVEILLSGTSSVIGSDTTSTGGSGTPVLTLGRAVARYTSEAAAAAGFANLEQRVDEAAALDPNLQVVPDRETESPGFRVDSKWFRYVRWDDTGQRAGVELFLNFGDRHVVFDTFSTARIAGEAAFSESHAQMLYRANQAAAIDYFDVNDLDLDLSDEERALLRDALRVDLSTYSSYFSGGSVTVQGPPIAEEPEVSEPSPEGCPPGWTFDAAGPSGPGCYRCAYPYLTGTVYDVEAHGCVRNGEWVEGAPQEVVI